MRRLAAHWLLEAAIALLAPGGYVHWLSHLANAPVKCERGKGDTPAPQHACELCGAYAAADGGAAPAAAGPLIALPVTAPVGRPAEPLLPPAALTRFSSRAPPPIS